MMIVSLAAMVVTPPRSAFAQQGSDQLRSTIEDEAPPDGSGPPTVGDEAPPKSNGSAPNGSDIDVVKEPTAEPAPPPEEPHRAFYYRPGDFDGVPYETMGECSQARQQAGNVGVCVMK